MEFLLLCAVGAAAGLIAGLVGLAGGIVVVPALTWLYGPEALHTAIVVSWFSVLFNSVGAAANQLRMRSVLERVALLKGSGWFLLGAVLVTPLMAVGAMQSPGLVNKEAVAILQLCLAAVMLFPVSDTGLVRRQNAVRDASFGGIIGAVSTIIGVGGGSYTIAYFVYGAGARFRDAIATANLAGLTVGALSVAGYLASLVAFSGTAPAGAQSISGPGMVAMIVAGLVAAPLGGMLGARMDTRRLRQVIIAGLIISAGRLLWA